MLPRGRLGALGRWWPSVEEVKTKAEKKRKSLLIFGPHSRLDTWLFQLPLKCQAQGRGKEEKGGILCPRNLLPRAIVEGGVT